MSEAPTHVQRCASSVGTRIAMGPPTENGLAERMYAVLEERELISWIHGAFVRLVCEKIAIGDRDWWQGIEEPERLWTADLLAALEDEEAATVAEAIREGWA